MMKYKTLRYAAIDLSEMLRQLDAGQEPDMEQLFEAALLLFGREHLREWHDNGGYDRIEQALQQNLQIFRDAETTGDGFIKRMYHLYTSGQLMDKNGKNILEISEQSESADIGLKKEIISDIARVMDISETVVVIAMVSAKRSIMEKSTNA